MGGPGRSPELLRMICGVIGKVPRPDISALVSSAEEYRSPRAGQTRYIGTISTRMGPASARAFSNLARSMPLKYPMAIPLIAPTPAD